MNEIAQVLYKPGFSFFPSNNIPRFQQSLPTNAIYSKPAGKKLLAFLNEPRFNEIEKELPDLKKQHEEILDKLQEMQKNPLPKVNNKRKREYMDLERKSRELQSDIHAKSIFVYDYKKNIDSIK